MAKHGSAVPPYGVAFLTSNRQRRLGGDEKGGARCRDLSDGMGR